jgi:hypothetical protein
LANKIQVKRGLKNALPNLSVGEFGFCTDTKELFIGSSAGNVQLANIDHIHDFTHNHDDRSYTESEVDAKLSAKADKTYVDAELAKKADSTTLSGHTSNGTIHVTQTNKDNWNSKAEGNHNHNLADLAEKSYNSLTNKPSIPSKTSELTNDSNFVQITIGTLQPTSGWWFEEV